MKNNIHPVPSKRRLIRSIDLPKANLRQIITVTVYR